MSEYKQLAEQLREHAQRRIQYQQKGYLEEAALEAADVIEQLSDIVESIVHCKDCIHYDSDFGVCRRSRPRVVFDNDFCNKGDAK